MLPAACLGGGFSSLHLIGSRFRNSGLHPTSSVESAHVYYGRELLIFYPMVVVAFLWNPEDHKILSVGHGQDEVHLPEKSVTPVVAYCIA